MDVIHVTQTGDTGGQKQNIKIPGFGTPVAARFFFGRTGATEGPGVPNPINGTYCAYGATDGTNQWCVGAAEVSTGGTSITDRWGASDAVVQRRAGAGGGGTPVDEAKFIKWIKDGVQIEWVTNAGFDIKLTVVLYGGDITAQAGVITPAAEDNTKETTVGFQSDAIYFASAFQGMDDTDTTTAIISMGFGAYDGSSITQGAFQWRSDDAEGVTLAKSETSTKGVANIVSSRWLALSAVGATSFTVTSKGASWATFLTGYLAFDLGVNGAAKVVIEDSPTAVGNHVFTGIGFKPKFCSMITTFIQTVDTIIQTGDAGAFGISELSLGTHASHAWADEDAQTNQDSQSLFDIKAINTPEDDGTVGFEADFLSFNPDGMTLNFTQAPGTARKWPVLYMR